MYNRYACHGAEFRRTEPKHEPCEIKRGPAPPPPPPPPPRPAQAKGFDFKNALSFLNVKDIKNILPKDIDLGDILLFLVLFLLFLENNDEECLIILGVLLFMK